MIYLNSIKNALNLTSYVSDFILGFKQRFELTEISGVIFLASNCLQGTLESHHVH